MSGAGRRVGLTLGWLHGGRQIWLPGEGDSLAQVSSPVPVWCHLEGGEMKMVTAAGRQREGGKSYQDKNKKGTGRKKEAKGKQIESCRSSVPADVQNRMG